eukprot:TRINITY_DN91662_c0_g1_i1.p1 TRINITY_DN91662_c0_g1~~TRINITY_DN91662_c0_g1_i1.p1  ORF type:complete len:265 (+),score=28.59 TRINITY_DN91662_c0_g1_i1:96-890(+)
MYWLAVPALLFMFRGKIGSLLSRVVGQVTPSQVSFYGHCMILLSAILYVIPLGSVQRIFFMLCMWSTVSTAIYTLSVNYPLPPQIGMLSLRNFAQIKEVMTVHMAPWLEKAIQSVDFHFLFFALVFLAAYPSIWPVAILGRRSLYTVCTYCAKNDAKNMIWTKVLKSQWENKLKPREKEAQLYSALAEIVLGFYLAASLLTASRQIFTTFLYWQYLTIRYKVPRSHETHNLAWMQMGKKVDPLLKAVPILNKPIDMAKGFFQQR